MGLDWITAMDMCAASGVIDYDAPAAIMGVKPRYVGHPNIYNLPTLNGNIPAELDTYNGKIVKPKSWKKKLFNILLASGGAVLAYKLMPQKVINILKKPFSRLRP